MKRDVSFAELHAHHAKLKADLRSNKLPASVAAQLVRMEYATLATIGLQHDALRLGARVDPDIAYISDDDAGVLKLPARSA